MNPWTTIARRQGGVITRTQLRACGRSERSVDLMLRAGHLERLARGVYLSAGAPVSYEARLWRAVLSTSGTLGFGTAAHLWGIRETAPARIDVIVDRPNHRPIEGVRQHRILLPSRSWQRHRGLPITTRTETMLDYAGRQRFDEASRLIDRALQRGWLRAGDLEHRFHRQPGRTGNVVLRAIASALGDGAEAESERRLHAILRSAGITGWRAGHRVWQHGELIAVLDVAIVRAKIAIEVDGWAYHSDVDRFQGDRTRGNRLSALGWTVLHFTWADIVHRPDYVRATVSGQIAAAA